MQKFFVDSNQIEDDTIEIVGLDVNHIVNVLRLKQNDKIQVCDKITNKNYIVSIYRYNKEKIITKIVNAIESIVETEFDICLYQGLPKADKMEFIIQKSVELGVKKIIPVMMERSIIKLEEKDKQKKLERWQKISEVAAKQSKRDIVPKIDSILNISDVYKIIHKYDLFIVAYEEEKDLRLKEVLTKIKDKRVKSIGVLIGPEGGISNSEIEKLKKENSIVVTLGDRILRTETAPIVVISNIIYELEGN